MTDYRKKIFHHRKPYDVENTSAFFVAAMRDAVEFHRANSDWYRAFTDAVGFDETMICSEEDLAKIPPVPSVFFKRNEVPVYAGQKIAFTAKSSGTTGSQSRIYFERRSFLYVLSMAFRLFRYYHCFSLLPAGYVVLGYSVKDSEGRGVAKTMMYGTKFAPAVHVEYALTGKNGKMEVNGDGIVKWLMRYAKMNLPVRLVGFPPFLYVLLTELDERGIRLKLNRHSRVMIGGGWKSFGIGEISHAEMTELLECVLGIGSSQVFEIYSTIEHPLPYVKCREGHFHTNIYTRPVVRNADTLEPVGYGTKGLLNLISPVMYGMPLCSVLTDDMATLHAPGTCACGCGTSWFELHGRAGAVGVKTCSAEASELAGKHNYQG